MPNTSVLRKAPRVISRAQKLIGLPHAVPLLARELDIPALHHVVIHRNNEQRRRVRGGIWIGIILEPRNKIRPLRDLVRNLSILSLVFADELQRGSGRGIIA